MVNPASFCDKLSHFNINFFTGVPDSLLKSFCAYIEQKIPKEQHIITANEGSAIAVAAGHYLGCGQPALVYMQNSGLGNAVNPLVSLADEKVYSIPMLMLIGWRGKPGEPDEPQHLKQGEITKAQLDILGIPYKVLTAGCDISSLLEELLEVMNRKKIPVALLVTKNTFLTYATTKTPSAALMSREAALEIVIDEFDRQDVIVSTTGKASRELYELRKKSNSQKVDFLTVGAMGHTASIGLGIAKAQKNKKVVVIDGDGSLLMHMGSMAVIAQQKLPNLVHIVMNNGCHESVGGQKTVAKDICLEQIAVGSGYEQIHTVTTVEELKQSILSLKKVTGTHFLQIIINSDSRSNLGRPTKSPVENKVAFMDQTMA
ncbi:phosphonopyruvate decarboxylase [Catenovulum sediminis]|uniref:Phosphonopyruvate decarboxylase n=1 Tax=Catenovulum sediminis TaxID=1740262 RepID=A0ABV1RGW1_9ALTE